MKKLSVNGKTFEEIFGERGAEVDEFDLLGGRVYFLKDKSGDTDALVDVIGVNDKVRSAAYVFYDGEAHIGYAEGYCFIGESIYYEATPNQIALLEAYRTNA